MKNFLLHVEFEDGREQQSYQPSDSPWGGYDIDNHRKDSAQHGWNKIQKQEAVQNIDWGNLFGTYYGGGTLTGNLRYQQPITLGLEHGVIGDPIDVQIPTRPRGQRITAIRPTMDTEQLAEYQRHVTGYGEAVRMHEQAQQFMGGEARRREEQRQRDLAARPTIQDRPVQRREQPQRNPYQRGRDFFGGNND